MLPKDEAPIGGLTAASSERPVQLSDLLLASAAREARVALANGWWEARYELDIDQAHPTGEGSR